MTENDLQELDVLLERLCEGLLEHDPGAVERLIQLMDGSEACRRRYLDTIELHATLWRTSGDGATLSDLSSTESQTASCGPVFSKLSEDGSLSLGLLPTTLHGTAGHLFSGWPVAYVAATVICGIALIIGAFVQVSHPVYVAKESPSRADPLKPASVARITALADCRWKQWRVESGEWRANPEIPKSRNPEISVSLGDKYRLASGFMEITYDTGAKVLLEAPCTYEIESARGGYLAIGKLTAKVESQESRDQSQTKIREHSRLLTLDSGLFAVRTPTAIVIDLGTEFGVEVEKSGATRSHVFQGRIELRSQKDSRGLTAPGELPVDHVIQLSAGESARVERGRNRAIAITREPGQPGKFVRRIPSSLILHPSSLGRPSSPAPRPSSLSYHLTDLGALGGKTSRACAINAAGQVVGEAATISGVKHAFLYVDGKMKDLDSVSDGNSFAFDINTLGQVIGGSHARQTGRSFAFLYSDGRMWDLGTLGGTSSAAFAINDAGQIVGSARNSSGLMRAFLYTRSAGMRQIASLDNPQTESWASDINAAGQVVGRLKVGSLTRAFLYAPEAGLKDLGTLGGYRCLACRINDAGQVVGAADVHDGSRHAILYDKDTGLKDLGTFNGPNSVARAINNFGQVVGYADYVNRSTGHTHAFLYHDGKMIDLNSLIDPTAGWTLSEASGINDFGLIVGKGIATDGNTRAFLLTPINGTGAGSR